MRRSPTSPLSGLPSCGSPIASGPAARAGDRSQPGPWPRACRRGTSRARRCRSSARRDDTGCRRRSPRLCQRRPWYSTYSGDPRLQSGCGCDSSTPISNPGPPSSTVISGIAPLRIQNATAKRSAWKARELHVRLAVERRRLVRAARHERRHAFHQARASETAIQRVMRQQAFARSFGQRRQARLLPGGEQRLRYPCPAARTHGRRSDCCSHATWLACSAVGISRIGAALPLRPSRPFSAMVLKNAKKR